MVRGGGGGGWVVVNAGGVVLGGSVVGGVVGCGGADSPIVTCGVTCGGSARPVREKTANTAANRAAAATRRAAVRRDGITRPTLGPEVTANMKPS